MKDGLLFIALIFVTTFAYSQVLIDDNFDSYTLGALGPQAAHWSTWSGTLGGTEDGIVTTENAFSGTQSFKIEGQSGPQDVLLLLGNKTSGNYKLSFKMFIETGKYGYWNLQKDETPLVQFGQEVYFDSFGSGSIDGGGANAATFFYPQGVWFDVVQYYDLDNDHTSLFIAGELVHSWQFSLSSQNGSTPLNQLGAIDFYARSIGPHKFFIDDVVYEQLPTNNNVIRWVKLTVDMAKELIDGGSISPNGIHVAGTFNGWSPDSTSMTDNGDSTYSAWVGVEQLTFAEYKFVNGNAWGSDETVPMACGVDNGSSVYNREYFAELTDSVKATVCFGHCEDCATVIALNTNGVQIGNDVTLAPNPARDIVVFDSGLLNGKTVDIQIFNQMGQVVKVISNITNSQFEVNDLGTGIYMIEFLVDDQRILKKLVVQ